MSEKKIWIKCVACAPGEWIYCGSDLVECLETTCEACGGKGGWYE